MAPKYAALVTEIERLEEILIDVEGILRRSDNARKLELIGLRRLLSAQMTRVRTHGDNVFELAGTTELATEYRARFSTIVRTIALHQAAWPAVAINERAEDYFQSAREAAAKVRDFTTWAKKVLTARQ